MALKDDVLQIAAEIADEAERLNVFASRLENLAELIPTPDEIAAERDRIRDAALIEAHVEAATGRKKIGRRDMHGRKLRVGDRVTVHGSERYGTAHGIVRGPGPDADDGKARVHVSLDGGVNDAYFPSVGRVARDARVRDQTSNGHDDDDSQAIDKYIDLGNGVILGFQVTSLH